MKIITRIAKKIAQKSKLLAGNVKLIEKENVPHKLVIALDIANAVLTPLPEPDISSPSSNLANLSFIISISAIQTYSLKN